MEVPVQPPVQQPASSIQQTPQTPKSSPQPQKPLVYAFVFIVLAVIFGIAIYLMKESSKNTLDTSPITTQGTISAPTKGTTQTNASSGGSLPAGTNDTQLEQDIQSIDTDLGKVESDLGNVEQGLNDQPVNLTE